MRQFEERLDKLQTDELWNLSERIEAELKRKIVSEKATIEELLRQLGAAVDGPDGRRPRPYPKVLPKYRNPNDPHETWAGRGKRPRWLVAELRSGKKLDDFRIK